MLWLATLLPSVAARSEPGLPSLELGVRGGGGSFVAGSDHPFYPGTPTGRPGLPRAGFDAGFGLGALAAARVLPELSVGLGYLWQRLSSFGNGSTSVHAAFATARFYPTPDEWRAAASPHGTGLDPFIELGLGYLRAQQLAAPAPAAWLQRTLDGVSLRAALGLDLLQTIGPRLALAAGVVVGADLGLALRCVRGDAGPVCPAPTDHPVDVTLTLFVGIEVRALVANGRSSRSP